VSFTSSRAITGSVSTTGGSVINDVISGYFPAQETDDHTTRRIWTIPALAQRGSRPGGDACHRSDEHTSELQSLLRISYAVFCLTKIKDQNHTNQHKNSI